MADGAINDETNSLPTARICSSLKSGLLHPLGLVRNERYLLIGFSALALMLFGALIMLVSHQVDRGKLLRLEQISRVQALNGCAAVVGPARDTCQKSAMTAAPRLPSSNGSSAGASPLAGGSGGNARLAAAAVKR